MNKRRILFFIVGLVCIFTAQAQKGKDVYLDMNAPQHERILDLLSKLTIACYFTGHSATSNR